jgi:hypothetical protein
MKVPIKVTRKKKKTLQKEFRHSNNETVKVTKKKKNYGEA